MNILEEIQNCSVEWKELGEISHFYGGLTGKTKSDFENGNAKYVTYKNIFNNLQVELNLLETVRVDENENQNSINYGDVLITGSSESKEEVGMSSVVTFIPDEPIYLNSFSFGIRFNEDVELLPEFTKYLFRSFRLRKQIEKTASGVTRYNVSKVTFKKIKVPLLPLEIQEKIVQILDKMTEYVTELTSELTSRKKQYSFYRDKLLSFEDEVYQVEWKTIQDVSVKIVTGVTPKKSCEDYYLKGTIPWLRTNEVKFNTITTTEKYVTEKAVEETGLKWILPNSIIIAISGATAGRVAMNSIPLTTNQHCCSISVDERIVNYKYLYYLLVNQNRQILSLKQGARGDLNMSMIKSLKIPVPSLEIQSRIVQVLDNFDTVCNDLNIGLPKEIELRQKQYEYFREKLLTFVAEGEYTDSTVQYSTDKT
ncbi:MAG: restriction endonuclease subunit S [Streptococcus parasanguinis]|nr:restriction endonuclease subunit S [Streptococcus parasanguinis]